MVPPCQIHVTLPKLHFILPVMLHPLAVLNFSFPMGFKMFISFSLVLDGPPCQIHVPLPKPHFVLHVTLYPLPVLKFHFPMGFKIFLSFHPHSRWSPCVKYMFPSPNNISYFLLCCICHSVYFKSQSKSVLLLANILSIFLLYCNH